MVYGKVGRNEQKIFRNLACNNRKKKPPKDAKNWENKENKFELYFNEKPGK